VAKRVILIHTAGMNEQTFGRLCDEILPGVAIDHVVDETLLQDMIAAGKLTDDVRERYAARAGKALAEKPDAVVLTCSSLGPAADDTEVHRIDTSMCERAVAIGSKIGIAATLPSTLSATGDLIQASAKGASRAIELRSRIAEGAFAAVRAGRGEEHDQLVRAVLDDLAAWADVIVLAQASMARAVAGADNWRGVPVLTSPRLGIERLKVSLGV
jgi:hypothetical protein